MKIQVTLWVQEADRGGALWSVMYIVCCAKCKKYIGNCQIFEDRELSNGVYTTGQILKMTTDI